MRRTVEDAHPEIAEARRLRGAPDVVDVDVELDDAVGLRLELRPGRLRVPRAGLREAGDAAVNQDARKLLDDVARVGRVMERVETDDAIHARVREIDAAPIELQ